MKAIITMITLAALTLAGYPARAEVQKDKKSASTETVVYDVNLNCEKCKAKLEKHIPFEKGVKDMSVDLEEKQVTVTFDPRKNTSEGIAKAIGKLGYTATVADTES